MRKRFLIPAAVLAAAGLAGGAFAASQSSSNSDPQQALVNDVAQRLHVTPRQLTSAFKQAMIDRVKAAAAVGKLTHAQATAIEKRIEQSSGLPFDPGPIACGPVGMSVHGFGPPPFEVPAFGPPAMLTGAARFLHVSEQMLRKELNGKSLADVAKAHGKSVAGLEHALISAAQAQLERAAKSGYFPRRLQKRILSVLSAQVHRMVGGTWRFAGTHGGVSISVRAAGGPPPFRAVTAPVPGGPCMGPPPGMMAPGMMGPRPQMNWFARPRTERVP